MRGKSARGRKPQRITGNLRILRDRNLFRCAQILLRNFNLLRRWFHYYLRSSRSCPWGSRTTETLEHHAVLLLGCTSRVWLSRVCLEGLTMMKAILAGTAALLVAGTTLAQAQYRPDGARRWQPSLEDMRAFG